MSPSFNSPLLKMSTHLFQRYARRAFTQNSLIQILLTLVAPSLPLPRSRSFTALILHFKLQPVHLDLTQIHKLVHQNHHSGLKENQVLRLGVVEGQRHHFWCKRTPTLTPHTASSIDFPSMVISARWEQLWCHC